MIHFTMSSDKAGAAPCPAASDCSMNTAGGTIVPASARSPTDVAAIFMR